MANQAGPNSSRRGDRDRAGRAARDTRAGMELPGTRSQGMGRQGAGKPAGPLDDRLEPTSRDLFRTPVLGPASPVIVEPALRAANGAAQWRE